MFLSKKGSVTELGIILFGIIFLSLLNFSLGYVLDSSIVSNYDAETTVSDYVETLDFGIMGSALATALLSVVTLFFSVFGINFVASISVLPSALIVFFTLFNGIIIFALIMYLVDRFWIG